MYNQRQTWALRIVLGVAAVAIVAIGGLSFIVWAHHMYVSGMHPYFGFFFATTTLIIAVPTPWPMLDRSPIR